MQRWFRNKFLKNPNNRNRIVYTRQRNFCLSCLRKEKRETFPDLYEKDIAINKKFWHTVKHFLSDKIKFRENILLINNEKIIFDGAEVANNLENFFSQVSSSKFSTLLKSANVAPVFRQGFRNQTDNQIRILFITSIMLDKVICGQLSSHADTFLKFQCSFTKGCSP